MIRAVGTSPLEAALELAPRAAELAPEAERERRVGAAFSSELAAAGLYRACVPASLGGGEAPPRELLGAIEALATGDGAAGWCVAVCATAGMLAAYLEPERAAEVYGDPDAVAGGVFAPSGRASADGDELTVSGRWRFASNVANCDWLMGGCVVHDGERPRSLESGRPDVRLVLMPAAAVEVIDTWSVSGLRATGSHDIAVDGLAAAGGALGLADHRLAARARAAVRVPALRPARRVDRRGRARDRPRSARRPRRARRSQDPDPEHPQARRARRDPVGARPGRGHPAAARGRCCCESGRSCLGRRAGRWRDPDRAPGAPAAGRDPRGRELGRARSTAPSRSPAAARSTRPARSQRRFRDVHAATQHMLVGPPTWELTGRSLLGLELDASQL